MLFTKKKYVVNFVELFGAKFAVGDMSACTEDLQDHILILHQDQRFVNIGYAVEHDQDLHDISRYLKDIIPIKYT